MISDSSASANFKKKNHIILAIIESHKIARGFKAERKQKNQTFILGRVAVIFNRERSKY